MNIPAIGDAFRLSQLDLHTVGYVVGVKLDEDGRGYTAAIRYEDSNGHWVEILHREQLPDDA